MIDKRMADIEAEIQAKLDTLYPNLLMAVCRCFSQITVFECITEITNNFAIDKMEWLKCPNENVQDYLIRERLLDSLIETRKMLTKEIERIMYGNR